MVLLWGELPEGMKETPSRVVKYWVEISQGIGVDPSESLSKVFNCGYDQVVIESLSSPNSRGENGFGSTGV